jgi:hypothetical protein
MVGRYGGESCEFIICKVLSATYVGSIRALATLCPYSH